MSWEHEATEENRKDFESYCAGVKKDFHEQNPEQSESDNPAMVQLYNYINYLLTRMYFEGLPEKEPRAGL